MRDDTEVLNEKTSRNQALPPASRRAHGTHPFAWTAWPAVAAGQMAVLEGGTRTAARGPTTSPRGGSHVKASRIDRATNRYPISD